jgi:trans-aconitate methyltransferase
MKSKSTSRDEISKRIIVARTRGDDARCDQISLVTRFTSAYDAIRTWCEVILRAEGVRIGTGPGHHEKTINGAAKILGIDSKPIMLVLDRARKNRNKVEYESGIETISEADVTRILENLDMIRNLATSWLQQHHPDLLPLL